MANYQGVLSDTGLESPTVYLGTVYDFKRFAFAGVMPSTDLDIPTFFVAGSFAFKRFNYLGVTQAILRFKRGTNPTGS